jgi:hypothetical protein
MSKTLLHSHLQVFVLNLAPFWHGNGNAHLWAVEVEAVVETIFSHLVPVNWDEQMHKQVALEKTPPFRQESKPHLQTGSLHIAGQ